MRQLRLEPGPGLNALSGETGAGKSLLVAALGLVLGERADTETIRAGADRAVVEALFDLSASPRVRARLAEAGFDDADELLVRRVVARKGRGGVYLNGSPATVGLLRRITPGLVELTAQHESIGLLSDAGCLEALDAYGRHGEHRTAQEVAWDALIEARASLARLVSAAQDRAGRGDYLRFQVEELSALAPTPGEDEALRAERERLRHAERLVAASTEAEATLYSGEGSAFDHTSRAAAELAELARIDPDLEPVAADLETAQALLEEAGYTLSRYATRIEADPARLDAVEDRLADLERVQHKHGCDSTSALLAVGEELAAELAELGSVDDRIADATRAAEAAEETARRAGNALTIRRRAAARRLGETVEAGVRGLGMPRATFTVEVESAEPGPTGADRVVFHLGPNPGEPAGPLVRLASGGELSRTLLALKVALAEADPVPVQVFDEVDAGIGGAVGEAVGRRLRDLARRHQVLVLTHLPQVAAVAERQFSVVKVEADGRTETSVHELDGAGRLEEISRMLGGARLTDRTRELAAELLGRGGEEGA